MRAKMVDVRVRVHPRARRTEVAGTREGALVVRVAAPPVDGRANAAVCALLAKLAGVPKSRVSVIRGAGAREKLVRIEGLEEADLPAALRLD